MFRKFRLRYLLIGLLILLWWWFRRREETNRRPAQMEAVEIEVPPEVPEGLTPSAPAPAQTEEAATEEPHPEAPEPRVSKPEPDDLRRIEGIGPKIAGVLLEAGIHSYAQLAAMSAEQIREVLTAGGVRVAKPDTWPEQASLAANEDWQGLEALQGQLKGGRRV